MPTSCVFTAEIELGGISQQSNNSLISNGFEKTYTKINAAMTNFFDLYRFFVLIAQINKKHRMPSGIMKNVRNLEAI
jgi:hypothetical protein